MTFFPLIFVAPPQQYRLERCSLVPRNNFSRRTLYRATRRVMDWKNGTRRRVPTESRAESSRPRSRTPLCSFCTRYYCFFASEFFFLLFFPCLVYGRGEKRQRSRGSCQATGRHVADERVSGCSRTVEGRGRSSGTSKK